MGDNFRFLAWHKLQKKMFVISSINFSDQTAILQDIDKPYKDIIYKGQVKRRRQYMHVRFDEVDLQIEHKPC